MVLNFFCRKLSPDKSFQKLASRHVGTSSLEIILKLTSAQTFLSTNHFKTSDDELCPLTRWKFRSRWKFVWEVRRTNIYVTRSKISCGTRREFELVKIYWKKSAKKVSSEKFKFGKSFSSVKVRREKFCAKSSSRNKFVRWKFVAENWVKVQVKKKFVRKSSRELFRPRKFCVRSFVEEYRRKVYYRTKFCKTKLKNFVSGANFPTKTFVDTNNSKTFPRKFPLTLIILKVSHENFHRHK